MNLLTQQETIHPHKHFL